MEESISSSRTPGASASVFDGDGDGDVYCYASGPATAVPSDDSGWTAYFMHSQEDSHDTYQQLQNSKEVPAKKSQGDRASSSTLSTASKTKAKAKKAAGTEENNKKRPRLEPAGEDPLQDTACSPAYANYATRQLHLQDGWQIAGCECEQRSSSAAPAALQWIEYCSRRRQWDPREGPDAEIKEVFA
ncbi:hypothetical protein D1007_12151 [Hordeum vulgare]|uniref:Uncharacterized protein n=1 Tax=Hordeum vulgare subsp. vulgare TaxID=112509 RepID=A0A8I6WDP9_HORVV|nr:uncharacterized protein LOC123430134 [Hordeum vulgare subsp. vulgare]KAE8811003.1 hypothetical protein D1007_12151 [Hordeum vulgare]